MCLGAIYWAHLDRIYYANDRKDAAKIGFDDEFIYEEIDRKIEDRLKPMIALMRDEAFGACMWEENAGKRRSINEIRQKGRLMEYEPLAFLFVDSSCILSCGIEKMEKRNDFRFSL